MAVLSVFFVAVCCSSPRSKVGQFRFRKMCFLVLRERNLRFRYRFRSYIGPAENSRSPQFPARFVQSSGQMQI